MAKQLETIWPIDPHTRQKHVILRRYWEAWLPIMTRFNRRVLFIDGFAGPGRYAGGEDGSPLVVLKSARDHHAQPATEVLFVFIERDRARYEHLVQTVAEIEPTLPKNFKVYCQHGVFDEEMTTVLDGIEGKGSALAPSLVFIDPFGFSHTPFRTVERIMKNAKCEVFITFMYEEINRFLSHPDHADNWDQLFGTDRWRAVLPIDDAATRRRLIHDIYRDQLRGVGIKHVRSFEMLNRVNSTDYFLFFGTHGDRGLEKMKEAMWKADPSGDFQYSDFTDAAGTIKLFPDEPDFPKLKALLVHRFGGVDTAVEQIKDFVVLETPFLASHYNKAILRPMELQGELAVVNGRPNRRKGTFPDGTVVRIL